MREAKIAITAPTLCAQRWFSATLDCSTFRWVTKPCCFLLLAIYIFFNSRIIEWQKVKLAPASFKESWKRTWWLERARLYARPIARRPRTCILTLLRGARRPFEEMEGWGLGWGGGVGLWGWGRFSRQPSSPPCPLGPGCQTQNCLKTSASSPKGTIFISSENGSNLLQFPSSRYC